MAIFLRNAVPQREQLVNSAVEIFGQKVPGRRRVSQLRGRVKDIRVATHPAFQYIIDLQNGADLPDVVDRSAELKACPLRNHRERLEAH